MGVFVMAVWLMVGIVICVALSYMWEAWKNMGYVYVVREKIEVEHDNNIKYYEIPRGWVFDTAKEAQELADDLRARGSHIVISKERNIDNV